jgi:small-conductance mechanosensitive channel
MIEEALRKRLRPIVNRRRRLHLAHTLSVCWLVAALLGIGLISVNRYLGFKSQAANWVLFISTALITLYALYRSRRMQPDYKAVARHIERQNPDLQALLLAAIEQQPEQPDGDRHDADAVAAKKISAA